MGLVYLHVSLAGGRGSRAGWTSPGDRAIVRARAAVGRPAAAARASRGSFGTRRGLEPRPTAPLVSTNICSGARHHVGPGCDNTSGASRGRAERKVERRMEREQALEAAVSQIERQFGKGAIMKMGDAPAIAIDAVSTGALSLDLALGIGGLPRGRVCEVFGPESSGKTTLCYHVIAEAQRKRRPGGVHRRRARHGPGVRPPHRRERRRPAPEPARQRRAGARDRRAPDPLGRARRARDRLGGGARAAGRDRGRDGRLPRRPAGPPDEPGAAQDRRHAQPHRHDLHLHQPAAREDRRHVRIARDDPGRPGAQVLLVGAARHPPHRDAQGGHRGRRQPRAA